MGLGERHRFGICIYIDDTVYLILAGQRRADGRLNLVRRNAIRGVETLVLSSI